LNSKLHLRTPRGEDVMSPIKSQPGNGSQFKSLSSPRKKSTSSWDMEDVMLVVIVVVVVILVIAAIAVVIYSVGDSESGGRMARKGKNGKFKTNGEFVVDQPVPPQDSATMPPQRPIEPAVLPKPRRKNIRSVRNEEELEQQLEEVVQQIHDSNLKSNVEELLVTQVESLGTVIHRTVEEVKQELDDISFVNDMQSQESVIRTHQDRLETLDAQRKVKIQKLKELFSEELDEVQTEALRSLIQTLESSIEDYEKHNFISVQEWENAVGSGTTSVTEKSTTEKIDAADIRSDPVIQSIANSAVESSSSSNENELAQQLESLQKEMEKLRSKLGGN